MVVFPDPPFELITSVVFILMSFAPFPHRATEKRQGYAKVMVCVINYFTGDAKSPRVGLMGLPGGLRPEDRPASCRTTIRRCTPFCFPGQARFNPIRDCDLDRAA